MGLFFCRYRTETLRLKEIEVMDAQIMIARKELPAELTWETGLLGQVYLEPGEQEPQKRHRLDLFLVSYFSFFPFCLLQSLTYSTQRTNLLRLIIRQSPLRCSDKGQLWAPLCVSIAAQTVEAIAAVADSCPCILPCTFFFSTALVECIYHLILVIQASPSQAERELSIPAF